MPVKIDQIEAATTSLIATGVTAVVGTLVWVVRTVFTNQRMLSKLQSEIDAREAVREVDRETLNDVRADMKELRTDVKELFKRGSHDEVHHP